MDIHFANPNDPQWETNTSKNKPTKAERFQRVEDRKTLDATTWHRVLREKWQPKFRVSCWGRWHGDTSWLMEIIGPGAAWPFIFSPAGRKQRVFGQMVWESFLQSLQLSRVRVGCHCWENIHQWKDRVVSSSWVISGLCSNMIEILESQGMSSGHSLITWTFCCKGNHVRKGLKRKHETKHSAKVGVAVVQSRLWCLVRKTLLIGGGVLVGTELPVIRGV